MGIRSYAQNFEDVILWRALGHVTAGRYVDVGAQHPIVDSVSRAFYELGWRGTHIEPTSEHVALLRQDRPDEDVIQAVVAQQPGVLPFYEFAGTGLSTASLQVAESHGERSQREFTQRMVTAVTLDNVLGLGEGFDIHWLKIDVEGFEREVLSGWRESRQRPWVVVIEATYPSSETETFEEWEPIVLGKGYELAYADGLNRFYLSRSHPELRPFFRLPPNVFDRFQLSGTATSFTAALRDECDRQIGEATAARVTLEREVHALRAELQRLQAESAQRDQVYQASVALGVQEATRHADLLLERAATEHARGVDQLRLAHEQAMSNVQDAYERALTEERSRATERGTYAAELLKLVEALRKEAEQARDDKETSVAAIRNDFQAALSRERENATELRARAAELQVLIESLRNEAATERRDFNAVVQQERKRFGEERARVAELTRQIEAAQETARKEIAALRELNDEIRDRLEQERRHSDDRLHSAMRESARNIADAREQFDTRLAEAQLRFAQQLEAMQRAASEQAAHHLRTERDAREYERELSNARIADVRQQFLDQIAAMERAATEQAAHHLRTERDAHEQSRALREAWTRDREELIRVIQAMRDSWLWRVRSLFVRDIATGWIVSGRLLPVMPAATVPPEAEERVAAALSGGPAPGTDMRNPLESMNVQEESRTMTLQGLLTLRGEQFVRAAYHRVLRREADSEGVRHYLGRLSRGYSRESVLFDLATSAEGVAAASYAELSSLPEEAFIQALYQRFLGRQPDDHGRSHYIDLLRRTGKPSRVVADIVSSHEATSRRTPEWEFDQDLIQLVHDERNSRGWRKFLRQGDRIARRIEVMEASMEARLADLSRRLEGIALARPTAAAPEVAPATPATASLQVAELPSNLDTAEDSDLSPAAQVYYRRLTHSRPV